MQDKESLKKRQEAVIALLAEGKSTAEIASCLSVSERTVKGDVHHYAASHGLRNRCHVVAHALRTGTIT